MEHERFTISELIRREGWPVRPKDVSDLFYARIIEDGAAPVVHGRRMIPADLVWLIKRKLEAAGKLPRQEVADA